ncbi:hypothetical protein RJT34_28556 [Clitoria ternatea]|uniref:Uncharacterized protein n=1 Tax=Clitoria ternatea TaxID=43366 RepID=A0AAN9FB17_CLITE
MVHNFKLLCKLLSRLTQICSVSFFSQLCKPIKMKEFSLFYAHCLLPQSCNILCPLFLLGGIFSLSDSEAYYCVEKSCLHVGATMLLLLGLFQKLWDWAENIKPMPLDQKSDLIPYENPLI